MIGSTLAALRRVLMFVFVFSLILPAPSAAARAFSDVPYDYWAWTWIDAIYQAGLTTGYPDGTYRPADDVSRAEIAVFLLRGIQGRDYVPPDADGGSFSDVTDHWAEPWIERLKEEGLASGDPDGSYRPYAAVTRAELAVFLLKAIHGPSYDPGSLANSYFTDTSGHWAEAWIEALRLEGMTAGYNDRTYRPGSEVSRAEMAIFLVSGLELPMIANVPGAPIGPYGGNVEEVQFDPTDPAVVYAGTWGAGAYKSTDGGHHWQAVNTGLGNLYVGAIAIDPSAPDTVYAGTYTQGVFRSTDGGQSWARKGTGLNNEAIVYSLKVDPNDPNTIYVGTRSPGSIAPFGGGIYRSVNRGESWSALNNGLPDGWAQDVLVHPTDPNLLFAATHLHGVYRSRDGGASWGPANAGIDDLSTRVFAMDLGSPANLHVGTWHGGGIFNSPNGADSWSAGATNPTFVKVYNLTIDPSDPNRLFASTSRDAVLLSDNAGQTWNPVGPPVTFVYSVAVNPANGDQILAGTAGEGLFRSEDGAASWARSDQGLQATLVTGLAADLTTAGHYYSSVFGGGVYRTLDGGATWSTVNSGITDFNLHDLIMDAAAPSGLFVATDTGGVLRTTNGGATWWTVSTGLPTLTGGGAAEPAAYERYGWPAEIESTDLLSGSSEPVAQLAPSGGNYVTVWSLAMDPQVASTLYAGTGGKGIFRTINSGMSWAFVALDGREVYDVAVDPDDSNRVLAGVNATPGSVYLTEDGGAIWTPIGDPLQGRVVYAVTFTPGPSDRIYAGTASGLVYSDDAGQTWVDAGLVERAVYSLVVDPTDPSTVYAGTVAGMFQSTNAGLDWRPMTAGLINRQVTSIALDQLGAKVLAGTAGSGAYAWSLPLPLP